MAAGYSSILLRRSQCFKSEHVVGDWRGVAWRGVACRVVAWRGVEAGRQAVAVPRTVLPIQFPRRGEKLGRKEDMES